MAASGFYTFGIVLNPHFPLSQSWPESTSIRLVTLASMGALVGWFTHSNRELSDRLRVAEERDPLTSLLDTRAFAPRFRPARSSAGPFGLILADLDGLKEVNDREGHAVGNDLLRRAAQLLGHRPERGDELARIGGDEFAIITSTSETDDVRALCGRLTAALHEGGVSMSFGWALYPRDGDTSLLLFPRRRRAPVRAEGDQEPAFGRRGDRALDGRTGSPHLRLIGRIRGRFRP